MANLLCGHPLTIDTISLMTTMQPNRKITDQNAQVKAADLVHKNLAKMIDATVRFAHSEFCLRAARLCNAPRVKAASAFQELHMGQRLYRISGRAQSIFLDCNCSS